MGYNSNRQCIEKIEIYCNKIRTFTQDFSISREELINDSVLLFAVSFALLQIGEIAKNLSKDFVDKTQIVIPWKNIKGMRDYFVHGYEDMDADTIWSTAVKNIPELKKFCEKYLEADASAL
jgi:uncharacterized protein with HEPN domain